MRDLSRCSDPSLNPAFERHWRDTLQTARQFRCLARELPLRTVRRAARRTIIRWLEQGMETRGRKRAFAFKQANRIRCQFGLDWEDLIQERRAA